MQSDYPMKKSIMASIIASICVVIFIKPILNVIWLILVFISNSVYMNLINQLYKNASLGHRNLVSVTVFLIAGSIIIGITLIPYILPAIRKYLPSRSIEKKKKAKKGLVFIYHFGIFLIIVSILLLMTLAYSNLQLNTSFQQRLTILAPKISDQEYKELAASWASMQSRDDYLKINSQMENIAKNNNIILPKPLLK